MVRMLRSEWLKVRKSVIWLLVTISPILAGLVGWLSLSANETGGEFPWLIALSIIASLHGMLFLPLLTGVFAALLCRYEHAGGGWKQLLALPVSRTQVYVVKFLYVMGLIALTQLLFLAVLLGIGFSQGGGSSIPWSDLLGSAGRGWLACLPLAALQLFVSTAWSSFAAPLALNVIFTIPNILIANSADYAPYYPWVQPMLAMIPRNAGYDFGAFTLPSLTLLSVVLISFVVFFTAGWTYFSRKAI